MSRNFRIVMCLLAVLMSPAVLKADDDELIARLSRQLTRAVPSQKVQAAVQLAKLGTSAASATDLLIACLDDADTDVRVYCSYALAEVVTDLPRGLKALVPLLADKNEHARYSAEWSIAKIAKSLEAAGKLDDSQLKSVTTSLEAALNRFAIQEHQPRHAQAIKSALATLADSTSELIATPPPIDLSQSTVGQLKAGQPTASQTLPSFQSIITDLQQGFATGDRVQSLQLIEQVRSRHLNQPEIVRGALQSILLTNDGALFQTAVKRWGDAAGVAMNEILADLDNEKLPVWSSILISNIAPKDTATFERMVRIVNDDFMSTETRCAAIASLGKTCCERAQSQACLVGIVSWASRSDELRIEAARALGEIGELPAGFQSLMCNLLLDENCSAMLRSEIAFNLHSYAPHSQMAAGTLANLMSSRSVNDSEYVDLANAVRKYGPLVKAAIKPLIAGLSSNEEFVRSACANAIGELGEAALPATDALVSIITDPQITISTKSDVAEVLRKIGPLAARSLASKIQHEDPIVREHVLRSLAILGPQASTAITGCTDCIKNEREELQVRTAAAAVLGAIGPAARAMTSDPSATVTALTAATESHQETSLRIAALLALARVQPSTAMPKIAAFSKEESSEMRVAAAFAKHLAGNTAESFQDLMALTEYSDCVLIEDTLLDIGTVVKPMLLRTLRDKKAPDAQRITCARVAAQLQPTDWIPLIEVLSDERLGREFYEAIIYGWEFDDALPQQVMTALQNDAIPTGAKVRMLQLAEYLTSDLGAGGEFEEWPVSFAISRYVEQSPREAITAMPSSETSNASGLETAGGQTPKPAKLAMPEEKVLIPEMQGTRPASPLASLEDRRIKVYYGTNRQPLNEAAENPSAVVKNASGYGAAIGLAIAAMATCAFGFVRRKSPKYTLAAFTGLAAISTLAVQSMRTPEMVIPKVENIVYGTQLSSTVEMGICEVTIPETHRTGELESPSLLLRMEITKDPTKHVVLKSVHRLDPNAFFEDMHRELEKRGSNVLVFIHGYNVSFEDAARRTAQMAFDLKFAGAPAFYSWPSQANWYGYRNDSDNIEASVEQIKSFLLEIANKSNATSINLVAHSMGNVGLTTALSQMGDKTKFNQIVLAAPDIDATVFKNEIAPKIVSKANRVTLYTSKTDLALIASKYFNHGQRAGDSGSEMVLIPGIQTIDATAVDSSLLGHSYYGSNVNVLYDLGQLLNGQPIEARDYLRPSADMLHPYWYFAPARAANQSLPSLPLRR